LTEFR